MSFDVSSLYIGFVAGLVGFAAWRYGRRAQSGRHMILAILLMGYAYFVPSPWWSVAIGAVLITLLFWP